MSNRQTQLKKQALERWGYVSKEDRDKLLEELKGQPMGNAVIELDEPFYEGFSCSCRARLLPIVFGTNYIKRDKRYLFLSDIPQEEPK